MIRHEAQALPNNHQVLLYQGGAAARRRWPGASAAALPWRYRVRPSGSSSLGDSRPAVLSHPVGMNAVVVNVPDVTLDPGDPCGHSGQKPRAQAAACPDRTRAIPCKVQAVISIYRRVH